MAKTSKKLGRFKKDLRNYLKLEFPDSEKYFCLIYGSYCYGLQKEISDIDLILVAEKITKRQKKNFAKFIIRLHKKYSLSLDDEVPHIVKTTTVYKDLHSCFKGDGFEKKNGTLRIPRIKKTKRYLSSKKIALRLLLNILTSKCIEVTGNKREYRKNKKLAYESLLRIIILNFEIKETTIKKIINYLITDGKVLGEDYLGYKDYPQIKKYLKKQIKHTLKRLVKKKILKKSKNKYAVIDKRWLEEIF